MKGFPIIFSADMVRAILSGTKTMTRRVITPDPKIVYAIYPDGSIDCARIFKKPGQRVRCPYGKPGDRLWVRETWYYEEHMHNMTAGEPDLSNGRYSHRRIYRADSPDYPVNVGVGKHGWTPSIFMPRWASRITLEITGIKVERLQEITKDDVWAEGLGGKDPFDYQAPEYYDHLPGLEYEQSAFAGLWDSLNAKCGFGWESNPWIWAISFRRVEP